MDEKGRYFRNIRSSEEIIQLDIMNMRKAIMDRMSEIACLDTVDEDVRLQQLHEAEAVLRLCVKEDTTETILLHEFPAECIGDGCFQWNGTDVECSVLKRIDRRFIKKGYLYTFHAPAVSKTDIHTVIGQYYQDVFQMACMDITRIYIQSYLEKRSRQYGQCYCSPSFGPGYYGMNIDSAPQLLGLIDSAKAGVNWNGVNMTPGMSLVGIYLISDRDIFTASSDCVDCIGQRGSCEFCQKNMKTSI